MAILTYAEFIPHLLKVLGEHPAGLAASAAFEKTADAAGLTADERKVMIPSGSQALYKNRIGWAHDSLKRCLWSESPKFGTWRITKKGVEALAAHPAGFTAEELQKVARESSTVKMSDLLAGGDSKPAGDVTPPASASPDDLINTALAAIQTSITAQLLEQISQMKPERFEQLVLDLLLALGYGASRADLQRVGRSGDGGIDGVISLDRLGLQKVHVQAKRWKSGVGSPEIQTFMGALQLQGADRGVLMTSGEITKPAIEAAARARSTLVLIDGKKLAELMIEKGVGIGHRELRIPKLDADYFME